MAHRKFRDRDDREWEVWDTIPSTLVRTTLEGGWLTFQAKGEKRRLAPIPLYWATASDEELGRMLERAKPALDVRTRHDEHAAGDG